MIKDDTRQTIKFIIWLIVVIILAYCLTVVIFYKAGKPAQGEMQEVSRIATEKTPITRVQTYYHLDRGINSYSLKGSGKKGSYYFIYLPGSKKGYLFPTKKGVSEAAIRSKFKAQGATGKISQVNLGWYRGRAVWEVTAKNSSGSYNYKLYEFKNGNLVG
ncbi:hypothetical protein OZY43_04265 [Lactobacillus sp. ESL0785]|uniref:hypothetical protein n=1 Tax=Lactobacillus sp. ESL0785 TaxID=2983232 RepID=UPI0023F62DEA|nr:hypothetical protein [Lactobacillus sp. ESL0785]WEV71634.1 hypothetical protein OZY43_04265 [Lactobacillus sp. ESL0785]